MLVAVAQLYPLIKALMAAAQGTAAEGYLEISLMADYSGTLAFLLEHGDHDLVVQGEYTNDPAIEIPRVEGQG